eukprot:1145545-Pelagomonas_calceolata.AAC.4
MSNSSLWNKEKRGKTKNSESTPYILFRRRRHIGSKSRESPSPKGKREASVGLVGFWKHAAPGHQSYVEYF